MATVHDKAHAPHAGDGYHDDPPLVTGNLTFHEITDLVSYHSEKKTPIGWLLAFGHGPQALIPVPLHRKRERQRGFNQAHELARQLAGRRSVPLLSRCLLRRRATTPQAELPAKRRRANLGRAFAVRSGAALPAHVALIDDVMTTGATVHHCAATLKRGGVERVDVWVIARA